MTLLATLGQSWAVAPEAYLMGNGETAYREVFILATSGIDASVTACREWFATHAPQTSLHLLVIADLPDIRNADDHARYEEALFRVYASASRAAGAEALHICLAGGFKTISSAAHQTADLLGCAKLFHITSPFGERFDSHESICNGISAGKLSLVDLGPRPGWPTIQELLGEAPALPANEDPVLITDTTFREKILNRIREANRLAQSEHELASLPFPQIARWSPAARHWLQQPLDPITDADWILALPKIDLHCHLGGFATHGALLHQVHAAAIRPDDLPTQPEPALPAGWPTPEQSISLEDYMHLGDASGSALLRDPGCLRRHIELLYQHFLDQNLLYAEVRCSPANYAIPGRSPFTVLTEIKETFDRCMREHPGCHVNLLIIGTRRKKGDHRTAILRHLMLAITAAEHWPDDPGCRVVGVDLAGFEDKETRAHYYREDFRIVHRAGLALTVHAGENDGSEAIWSAVFDLNTRRIGHALTLGQSPELLRSVADRRIGVEMCPYANFQIRGFAPMPGKPDYPLKSYLDAGVSVTINTDNIGISSASLTDNFLLLPRISPGITRLDALRLLRNSIDQAFLDNSKRTCLMTSLHIPQPS